ncbi:hypothetical protein [Streptomyces sp. 4F14]|uniref:hypothetical protein n=1 Tax=Streptomyces sp. 4F14 TaxID=3394380 RepID=UPI003A83539B
MPDISAEDSVGTVVAEAACGLGGLDTLVNAACAPRRSITSPRSGQRRTGWPSGCRVPHTGEQIVALLRQLKPGRDGWRP